MGTPRELLLPKISMVGSGRHFPDLEEVPALKSTEERTTVKLPPKKRLNVAAKRFNQMAFSVLANIVDEKMDRVQEKEAKEADKKAKDAVDGGDVQREERCDAAGTTTSSPSPRRSTSDGRTLLRQGSSSSLASLESSGCGNSSRNSKKGPSFMSVLRLASYRRRISSKALLGRKGGLSVASSLEDLEEEVDNEHIAVLPDRPRFCATLSMEAQYAMLKCYEDVLVDNIQTRKAAAPAVNDATLFRVKTPHDSSFRSLHLTEPGAESTCWTQLPQLWEDVTDGAGGSGGDAIYSDGNATSLAPSRESTECQLSQSRISNVALPSIVTPLRPGSGGSSSMGRGMLQPVPRDKQLRLSYRFQTAMDILDAVRDQNGELMASARSAKLAEINPPRNYNLWSKGWSKEFQFEYNGVNGAGGMIT